MKSWRSKSRKSSRKFLLVLIPLIIALALLSLPIAFSDKIKLMAGTPFQPVQKAFLKAGQEVKRAFLWLPASWAASNRVKELEGEVERLQNRLVNLEATMYGLRTELASVTEYYKEAKVAQKPLLAHVIGYDTSDFRKTFLIDAGSKHGVAKDSIVLAREVLVGRVSAVGPYSSRVILITDPASRVPARILETSDLGVVEGTSGGLCRLKYLPNFPTSDGRDLKGFKVVSAPVGGMYPDSLYIATVAEDEEEGGRPYKTLKLKPGVDLAKVDTVLILNPPSTPDVGDSPNMLSSKGSGRAGR
ncbi:MAG TPA: rod shape-determining protein MreC [Candidatus Hypogeohydataceae bacterium YC41]